MGKCFDCSLHHVFTDEVDGEYWNDGCICDDDTGKETHLESCPEYTNELKDCPAYKSD